MARTFQGVWESNKQYWFREMDAGLTGVVSGFVRVVYHIVICPGTISIVCVCVYERKDYFSFLLFEYCPRRGGGGGVYHYNHSINVLRYLRVG